MNPAADAVRRERLRRKWSARRCALESGNRISNTWWSSFENGIQPLTDSIVEAVAAAFDWPADWPDTVTPSTVEEAGDVLQAVNELAVAVEALADRVGRLERKSLGAGDGGR